jgi:hypothetical protein
MKTPIQVKIIETVKSITPLKDEQIVAETQWTAVVVDLPIDTLDNVRSALKVALGDRYREVRVRYRGPRRPRSQDTLKRDAVRYTIYQDILYGNLLD